MRPEHDADAIVIGAGFGGVTCAARLAAAGWRVALLDKNHAAGGKALTITVGTMGGAAGARHDLWPIAGGPAGASRFHELARLIGLDARVLLTPEGVCEFVYLGADGARRSFVAPARAEHDPRALLATLRALGVPPWRLGGFAAMSAALALWPERALGRLDGVSAAAWLRAFRLPRGLESWLLALFNVLFVVPVDRLPASEAIRTLRQLWRGGAGRYHAGGFGRLAVEAAAFVAARGGRFLPSTRATAILVEDGRAVGVRTARGVLRAPVIVSNAGIQATVLRLAGAAHFPEDYVARVERLEPSWALVGARYRLSAPVFEHPMTVVYADDAWLDEARLAHMRRGTWPRDPLVFVTVPALWDPSLASGDEVRQVALMGVLAPADADDRLVAEATRRGEATLDRLWPRFASAVIARHPYGADQVATLARDVRDAHGGACIGLGQLIGQCGRSKPSARTPLPGLWLVGCDAGGFGCGTHQAVDSGFRVAEALLASARGAEVRA